jgi:hypothetical protein
MPAPAPSRTSLTRHALWKLAIAAGTLPLAAVSSGSVAIGASVIETPADALHEAPSSRRAQDALDRIERRFAARASTSATADARGDGADGADQKTPKPNAETGADAATPRSDEAADGGSASHRARVEARRREAALRALVANGLLGEPDDRRDALALLADAVGLVRPERALRILSGEGSRPDLVHSDPEARRRAFHAMASTSAAGVRELVRLAVEDDEPVGLDARASLPEELPTEALALLADELASGRELFINRAAMIAGAHGAATLIPNLIAAQYEAPREKRGDEAWIAIGKSISYIAGAVPIVGDASGAFQPVPGTIFEGSVLRIMESVVEIYRTEVHVALASTVERATGLPAPPFGYDRDRWMAWYREEFPSLARAHAARDAEREAERSVRSQRSTDEG